MKEKSIKDSYIIKKDLIYSCYFKRAMQIFPSSRLVSVARYAPINFNGSFMRELNPPEDLFMAYKAGDIDRETFIEVYYDRVLAGKDVDDIYNALKGKVICCWEKPDDFCHRHIILDWIDIAKGLGYTGGEV